MYRLIVIPEIGNSAQSQPKYETVQAAAHDGKRLTRAIFGDPKEDLPRFSDESMDHWVAARISAMMRNETIHEWPKMMRNESAAQKEPKILEMFSMSELEGLLTLQQPSVRVVVTDLFNRIMSNETFRKNQL